MQLEVGLASQELAAVADLEDLLQALLPIPAGKQQQEPEDLQRRGGDVRVIVIEPQAEVCVGERGVERKGAFECDAP